MHDLHGTSAKHVRGADHHRIANAIGHRARFPRCARDAGLGLLQSKLLDQRFEAVAILRQIDGVRRGAQNWHTGSGKRCGKLKRRLAAELNDHALHRAARVLLGDDLEHILYSERLKIKPVGGIVIGRDGLRIAVDHDRLVARCCQREAGVAAAIVEFDTLADTIGATTQDDDFLSLAWVGLASRRSFQTAFVSRVHIGRGRGELCGASVDAFEHRLHAKVPALLTHILLRHTGKLSQPCIRKTHRF